MLLDDKKLNHKVVSFCSNNSRYFFWRLTAYENLRYFCALNNTNDNLANIDELAIKFNIFNKLNRPLQELSLGEIQKINLIRGICIDTEIYIFDEADASLDRDSKKCFFDEIENLKRKNKIIIHVTHEMNYPYHIKNKIINSNDFKD